MSAHTDQAAAERAVHAAVEAALSNALSAALPNALGVALPGVLPSALGVALPDALASAGVSSAPPERPMLTKKELAEHLNVSVTSVDTLMSRGDIVPVRVGGSVRFTRQAVDDFVRRNAGRSRRRRSGRLAA